MSSSRRSALFSIAGCTALVMSACGSDGESTTDEVAAVAAADQAPADEEPVVAASSTAVADDDHSDVDHDDDDHDEDHDHNEDHDHDASGGLGAHEHGTAELTVAWIGDEVAIDLVSPNVNVFGFEYEPVSDEDLAIVTERTAVLTGPGIVSIHDGAECTLEDPVSTEVERDGSHSEITVSWRFVCDQPDEAGDLDFSGLFAEFPGFEDVDAQWISDTQQSAAELTPTAATLSLDR